LAGHSPCAADARRAAAALARVAYAAQADAFGRRASYERLFALPLAFGKQRPKNRSLLLVPKMPSARLNRRD
jgi:hypothetical protein